MYEVEILVEGGLITTKRSFETLDGARDFISFAFKEGVEDPKGDTTRVWPPRRITCATIRFIDAKQGGGVPHE